MLKMFQRQRTNPARELAMAMRVAAAQIECAPARAAAAREADAIPLLFAEKMPNTDVGRMARTGRVLMRNLGAMAPEDRPDAAKHLREIAGVIDAPPPPDKAARTSVFRGLAGRGASGRERV